MNGHLCLNLKILRQYRIGFHKLIAHRTIACHNILDIAVKQPVNTASHHTVSEIMERSLILCKICRGESVANYHICAILQNLLTHFSRILSRIGIIPIHHKIALGINITEHTADYIPFSLLMLVSDYSPCLTGNLICAI